MRTFRQREWTLCKTCNQTVGTAHCDVHLTVIEDTGLNEHQTPFTTTPEFDQILLAGLELTL